MVSGNMAMFGFLVLLFFSVFGVGTGLLMSGYLTGQTLYVYLGVTILLLSTIPLFLSAFLKGG
jgi:hypothetical protein